MTRPETVAADAPFPGAHPQVPGMLSLHERQRAGGLALESRLIQAGANWTVRLPVRREQVTVTRETVVIERVTALRETIGDRAHIEDSIRRETVRVDTDGEVKLPASLENADES